MEALNVRKFIFLIESSGIFSMASLLLIYFFPTLKAVIAIPDGLHSDMLDLFIQRSLGHFTSAGNGVDRVHLSLVLTA